MTSGLDELRRRAVLWRVSLDNTLETPSSFLGFGVRENLPVVLKVTKELGDESHSGKVLESFSGAGVVRVYQSDIGAVLMERLVPGTQLVSCVENDEDDEATRIISRIITELANHVPPGECPTVADWGRGFDWYLKRGGSEIPLELVHEASQVFQNLAGTQHTTMLLHGDLQHYNVLFDANRGWVAIDPKGVTGELEYEVGALLRNPTSRPDFFTRPEIIERRLAILVAELSLDYDRSLNWSFAQAVLSAIWTVEDGYPLDNHNSTLELAKTLKSLLR